MHETIDLVNFILLNYQQMNPGLNFNSSEWMSCNPQVFWGEIAPFENIVQVYENKNVFLDLLEGYVLDGLRVGDCVIIIATDEHITALKDRMKKSGCNVNALITDDQFITLNADLALSKFMINGWPDQNLFMTFVSEVIAKARARSRQVRTFGEMVAVLWAQGYKGATVQLEQLWRSFCEREAFCLFCAYPKTGLAQNIDDSIHNIYCTHSKLISGTHGSQLEIFYKTNDADKNPN